MGELNNSDSVLPDVPVLDEENANLQSNGVTRPASELVIPDEQPKKSGSKIAKRTLLAAAAAIILIGAVGSVIAWRHTRNNKYVPLTKVTVQLQWLHGAEFAGMYVARDKGYYKDVGLEVNLKEYEDGVDINNEVSTGIADYGVNTPLEIIIGRNDDKHVKAIAAIYQISPYAIAALKESKINTPTDFKGKILGSLGTNNEAKVTYAALLASAGLGSNEATVKGVDFDAVKVLKDHDADTVDIYRTDQTFLLNKAKISYTLIYPELYGLSSYGDTLMTSDAKIAENPEQVRAFVKATLMGWMYVTNHQDETLSILTKYENQTYRVPGYEKFVLGETIPLVRPTGSQSLGAMDYTIWNRIFLTAQAAGLITAPMDVSDLYTGQFVQ